MQQMLKLVEISVMGSIPQLIHYIRKEYMTVILEFVSLISEAQFKLLNVLINNAMK